MITKQQALNEFHQLFGDDATWDDYASIAKHLWEHLPKDTRQNADALHQAVMHFCREQIDLVEVAPTTRDESSEVVDLEEVQASTELNQSARDLARVKVNDLAQTFQDAYSEDFGQMLQNLQPIIPNLDTTGAHGLVLQTLHSLETEKRTSKKRYRNAVLDVVQNTLRISFTVGVVSFVLNFNLVNCGLNGLAASAVLSPVITWYQGKRS